MQGWANEPAAGALGRWDGSVTDEPPKASRNLFSDVVAGILGPVRGARCVGDVGKPRTDGWNLKNIQEVSNEFLGLQIADLPQAVGPREKRAQRACRDRFEQSGLELSSLPGSAKLED